MKRLVIGNWKMNGSKAALHSFIRRISEGAGWEGLCDLGLCLPYVYLDLAVQLLKDFNLKIAVGAQNCHTQLAGPHTGEISAKMLKDVGAELVILGHSERKAEFAEDGRQINDKLKQAIQCGLRPILCVGEPSRMQRQPAVVEVQLKVGLNSITEEQLAKVIVAYEPAWAVGAPAAASVDLIFEAVSQIKAVICEMFGQTGADTVRVLYGGAVSADSAKEILAVPGVDGILVGRASLDADELLKIVKC